jgi:hypothetical protein
MSFLNEASKLFTNKYFLYFVMFLTATNIFGYLVTNKLNAIVFFILIGVLTHQFSKNMAVVLLVSLLATNFLMVNRSMREGLENQVAEDSPAVKKIVETDEEIAKAVPAVKTAKNNDEVKDVINNSNSKQGEPTKPVDMNNEDLNMSEEEADAPKGVGEKISTNKKGKTEEHFGPRLDYAATIEQSYQNLDNLLGTDSIKQLTTDTQKLMQQQQNLFNTMNQMVPVLEGAQNMLKTFKIDGLTNSLKNIGGLTKMPIPAPQK